MGGRPGGPLPFTGRQIRQSSAALSLYPQVSSPSPSGLYRLASTTRSLPFLPSGLYPLVSYAIRSLPSGLLRHPLPSLCESLPSTIPLHMYRNCVGRTFPSPGDKRHGPLPGCLLACLPADEFPPRWGRACGLLCGHRQSALLIAPPHSCSPILEPGKVQGCGVDAHVCFGPARSRHASPMRPYGPVSYASPMRPCGSRPCPTVCISCAGPVLVLAQCHAGGSDAARVHEKLYRLRNLAHVQMPAVHRAVKASLCTQRELVLHITRNGAELKGERLV